MGASFATIQDEISDLYREEQSERNAVLCIAQIPAEELAEFIVDAYQRGWISNFNLGLNEDGEII